jgi:hypothetical protein
MWPAHVPPLKKKKATAAGESGHVPCETDDTRKITHEKTQIPALENGESYVLIFVFYEVVGLQIAWFDVVKRLIVCCEWLCGQSRHRHVGISVGTRKNTSFTILPYDFSCWNGRGSGATELSYQDDNDVSVNRIKASDAVYMDIPLDVIYELLRNHEKFSGAYVWNKLPTVGAVYPSVKKILYDLMHYCLVCKWAAAWDMSAMTLELEKLQSESQCAQYVLLATAYLLCNNCISMSGIQKNKILSLLFQRTSLHPHTLWKILSTSAGMNILSTRHKIRILQHSLARCPLEDTFNKELRTLVLAQPFTTVMLNPILILDLYGGHISHSTA